MSKGRSILLDKLYKAKEDLTLGLLRSLHVGYPLLFLEILFLTEEKKVHEANLMAEALTGSSKVWTPDVTRVATPTRFPAKIQHEKVQEK